MAYTEIDNPKDYFEVIAYAGDGNTTQVITANFQVDLSWIKHRSTTAAHTIQDSVRGFNAANKLSSNENDEENDSGGATWENYGHVSAVSSSSFTVTRGANTPYQTNASGVNYIAWHWKESATAGFDILKYEGNATNRTISHSLSAVPHVMIIKNLESTSSSAEHWLVYHKGIGNTHGLLLNTTDAKSDDATYFQDTDPTSSVFSIGTADRCNKNNEDNIAYLWSEKQGFSKFGTYTGNGNVDGSFVYTGFRPAFLMIKQYDAAGTDWTILDNKRPAENPADQWLAPNTNAAEVANDTTALSADLLSNGFKLRGSASDGTNGSSDDFIYMAFAEAPFVNSNGVPCNAR